MSARNPAMRLVTFGVGDSWFAADIVHVERVLRHDAVFPIPGMPAWMEGVIEHQGRVVPVVDLHRRFGLAGDAPRGSGRLLLFTLGEDVMAAAVDRVVDVRPVAAGELAPPPRLVRGIAGDFLRGMVRQGDAMILVLDLPRLFSDDEQATLKSCVDATPVVAPAGHPIDA